MTHGEHTDIEAATLDREIDHEIRSLRQLGHDTPGICSESIEMTERCRRRLTAGKSCADFDPMCFAASVEAAVAKFDGTEPERDRMVYALMDRRVPDDHGHYEDVECDLIHRGLLTDRHGYLG